ncbi:MAG: AbrB/MazE/SpoVT family DNA-binding domain-containing protein [Alphaproteobacteria bacterium]
MNGTITIDKAGRVVIPKKVRDRLRLAAGDTLALEFDGERVVLKPAPAGGPTMRKKRGIWVLSGGEKLTQEDVDRVREEVLLERERILLGLEE